MAALSVRPLDYTMPENPVAILAAVGGILVVLAVAGAIRLKWGTVSIRRPALRWVAGVFGILGLAVACYPDATRAVISRFQHSPPSVLHATHRIHVFSNGETPHQLRENEYFVGKGDTKYVVPIPGLPRSCEITSVTYSVDDANDQSGSFARLSFEELPKDDTRHNCVQFIGRASGDGRARIRLAVLVSYTIRSSND